MNTQNKTFNQDDYSNNLLGSLKWLENKTLGEIKELTDQYVKSSEGRE